jgi:hypothetical protein
LLYRVLLLNADVDGFLLEGHRDEILRLLGGGGAEQHRLPLPTDTIQCQPAGETRVADPDTDPDPAFFLIADPDSRSVSTV